MAKSAEGRLIAETEDKLVLKGKLDQSYGSLLTTLDQKQLTSVPRAFVSIQLNKQAVK